MLLLVYFNDSTYVLMIFAIEQAEGLIVVKFIIICTFNQNLIIFSFDKNNENRIFYSNLLVLSQSDFDVFGNRNIK